MTSDHWQEDMYFMNLIASTQLSPDTEASISHHKSDHRNQNNHTHTPGYTPSSNNSDSSNGTVAQADEAYINAGELVLLNGNMTDIHKQDALASVLFAQFAADYKLSRAVDPRDWTNKYGVVLGQIGWVLVKNSFEEVKVDDLFVVSKVVLEQFGVKFDQLDDQVIGYLRHFLNDFEVLKDDKITGIFYNKSYSNGSINFAVDFYDEEDDSIRLFTTRVFFDACEVSRPYLFHLFESDCVGGKVHVEFSQYKLNEDTYSKVRETIVDKLGTRMKNYVTKMKPFSMSCNDSK